MADRFPDQGAERWMLKYIKSNLWRLFPRYDLDDLVQEGYAAYYETLQRYEETAKESRHIMSLFMLVLRSRIETLVRVDSRRPDVAASVYLDMVEFSDDPKTCAPEGMLTNDFSTFYARLIKAPKIVQDAVEVLVRQDEEILSQPYERYDNGRRETFNERLCSILGFDPHTIDIVGLMRKQFA